MASQLIEGSLPSSPHHSCPSAISHRRSPIVNHSSIPPLPPAPPWVGPRAPTAAHPPPPSPSPTPAPSGRSSGASPPAPPSAGTSSASFGASIPTQPPPPQHGGCEPPPPQGLPPLPTATQNSGRLIHIKTRPLPGASGRGGGSGCGRLLCAVLGRRFPPSDLATDAAAVGALWAAACHASRRWNSTGTQRPLSPTAGAATESKVFQEKCVGKTHSVILSRNGCGTLLCRVPCAVEQQFLQQVFRQFDTKMQFSPRPAHGSPPGEALRPMGPPPPTDDAAHPPAADSNPDANADAPDPDAVDGVEGLARPYPPPSPGGPVAIVVPRSPPPGQAPRCCTTGRPSFPARAPAAIGWPPSRRPSGGAGRSPGALAPAGAGQLGFGRVGS